MVAVLLTARPAEHLTAQSASVATLAGSTRSAGLGGAGAALVGDAGALFANPAGIATIRRFTLEASYERFGGDTTLSSAAAAVRVGRFDWGVGAQALDHPGTPGARPTDVVGLGTLVLRYGMLAAGTSVKYARETIAGVPAHAWAGDAGLAIAVFDIMALGASVQNLGGDLGGGAHLPRRTRAGFTMNYADPQGTLRLLTTVEGQWETGTRSRLVAGAEAGVVTGGVGLVGRVGATGGGGLGGSPVAVGAGLELGRWHLDYAYRSYDPPAGGRHRFGARWTP